MVKKVQPLTFDELNQAMGENIRGLLSGDVTPSVANAVATSAGVIFRGVRLQMEYARLTNKQPTIPMLEARNPGSEEK